MVNGRLMPQQGNECTLIVFLFILFIPLFPWMFLFLSFPRHGISSKASIQIQLRLLAFHAVECLPFSLWLKWPGLCLLCSNWKQGWQFGTGESNLRLPLCVAISHYDTWCFVRIVLYSWLRAGTCYTNTNTGIWNFLLEFGHFFQEKSVE